MTLSERITLLQTLPGALEQDLRVIEMQVSRAEDKLLRITRDLSSWTRSDLRLRMIEDC